jgi:hypothetical protein
MMKRPSSARTPRTPSMSTAAATIEMPREAFSSSFLSTPQVPARAQNKERDRIASRLGSPISSRQIVILRWRTLPRDHRGAVESHSETGAAATCNRAAPAPRASALQTRGYPPWVAGRPQAYLRDISQRRSKTSDASTTPSAAPSSAAPARFVAIVSP